MPQKQNPLVVVENERTHRKEIKRPDLPAAKHNFGGDPLFGSSCFVVTPEEYVGCIPPRILVDTNEEEIILN